MSPMKQIKITAVLFCSLIFSAAAAQDAGTPESKIADLLLNMPVNDFEHRDSLAEESYNLGDEGLEELCSMVVPPGTGDDTKARFAIESLSKYLSREVPSGRTKIWERVCIGYATQSTDREVQSFFIRQLEWIGGSATIVALTPYLSDDFLCHPSISSMRKADPGLAAIAFTAALPSLSGMPETETIRAIGDLKVLSANSLLVEMLARENETDLRRNILGALASIGSADSYKPLIIAAKSVGYQPEPTGATMALLEYAKELGRNGDRELSNRICMHLMKKCKAGSQMHFKSCAMEVYADNTGIDEAMPLLVRAMRNNNKACRMKILNYGMARNTPAGPWIKELDKTRIPEVQAEIIYLLGSLQDTTAVSTLIKYLDSPDAGVRAEAVSAIASIEGSSATSRMFDHMMKYSAEPDLTAVKNAILSTAGMENIKLFTDRTHCVPDPVKIVIMEILAEKGSNDFFDLFMDLSLHGSNAVRHAAVSGLKDAVTEKDLGALLGLLAENQDSLSMARVQQAIVSSLSMPEDKNDYLDMVFTAMEQTDDKAVYIPVLAGMEGERCLNALIGIFENSGSETAFDGYVMQVSKSGHTPDQKLLLLRKIMYLTEDARQQNKVIDACGRIKTFPSCMFVSGFMENELLSKSAALATLRIALPSPGKEDGLYGDNVKAALTRAKEMLSQPENTYTRVHVERYLETMPDDRGYVSIFSGNDLEGWQGLVEDPVKRAKMHAEELAAKQAEADKLMHANWKTRDGILVFIGDGYDNICTVKEYGDFEMIVDWKIGKNGDSGIYLRGSPQVQIWDPTRIKPGAEVGSGGLFNNLKNQDKPLQAADNPISDWNTFRITMTGERVTVYLNGILVVDDVVMENYWDRSIPIFPRGPVELQAHGSDIAFRDIYIRER